MAEHLVFKKNEITTIAKLSIGDRFYFLNDKKKIVHTKVEHEKIQTHYQTYKHFALQDGKRIPDMKKADTQVVFLRSTNN